MGAVGRWVLFLDGAAQPDRALVGGKAWGIAVMRQAGLPVPPAFAVTTEACRDYLAGGALPDGLLDELHTGIAMLEAETGRRFGAHERPLLLSVRSGAAVSMPGMLDTVLNLGIDEEIEAALATESGDAGFARDTHRRFHEMYARIVLKAEIDGLAPEGPVDDWRAAVAEAGATGSVPESPAEQLLGAVRAVFESWNGRRAKRYRRHHGLADDAGTAVTVQAMVFGNLGRRSGTGVLFSRNPLSGAPEPYGEYLARAQGEDVVSGLRTPQGLGALASSLPEAHAALIAAARRLEALNRDVQDIEFSIQEGALYLLQTRTAARAPAAAIRIAVDLVNEGTISTDEALARVSAAQVRTLLMPRLDDGAGEDCFPARRRREARAPASASARVVSGGRRGRGARHGRRGRCAGAPDHQPGRRARHGRRPRRRDGDRGCDLPRRRGKPLPRRPLRRRLRRGRGRCPRRQRGDGGRQGRAGVRRRIASQRSCGDGRPAPVPDRGLGPRRCAHRGLSLG